MDRLTIADEKLPDGTIKCSMIDVSKVEKQALNFYLRLKRYEDLDASGRLVRLRAGIGDTVYAIIGGRIVPMEIQYIYVSRKGRTRYHAKEAVLEKNFRDPAFGRDVFLTEAAAERAVRNGTAKN